MERQRIARLLPEIFQRTLPAQWWRSPIPGEKAAPTVLGAILAVMDQLHAPTETALENLEAYFDPLQAPEEWLPFLACWLDLDRFLKQDEKGAWKFPGGSARLRQLIMEAVSLNKERGIYTGLLRFLKIATGIDGIEIITATGSPYHITISCPAPDLQAYGMSHGEFCSWLAELVSAEKPAYVTCEVEVEPQTREPRA
jgi:phage tail-like protein